MVGAGCHRDGRDVRVAVGPVALAKARDVRLGAVERLGLADASDLLLQLGGDVAGRLARGAEGTPRQPREDRGRQEDERDHGEAHECQRHVQQQHREDDADQPKQRPEQLRQALGQELIQGVNVIGDATHEVADRPTIEECERQPPEMLEQPTAQAGQQALPHGPNLEDLGPRGQGADGVHGEQAGQGPRQAGRITIENVAVDRPTDQPGRRRLRRGTQHDQPERREQLALVRRRLAQQAPGRGGTSLGRYLDGRAIDYAAHAGASDEAGVSGCSLAVVAAATGSSRSCEPRLWL